MGSHFQKFRLRRLINANKSYTSDVKGSPQAEKNTLVGKEALDILEVLGKKH